MRSWCPLLCALAALAAIASAPGLARADDSDDGYYTEYDGQTFFSVNARRTGLLTAQMYLRWDHARDADRLSGLTDVVVGGISTRAVYGKRVGYAFGMGFELGAAGAPGFAGGIDLYPVGMAVTFGPTGYLGVFAGIGANGVTGRIPGTLVMPAELRLELDVTRWARIGALLAVAWIPLEEARQHGSWLIPGVDETTMALSARFGKTFAQYGANMGRGYFMRLERKEQMKTVFLGASFGVELDATD
jgi:hypothetical protein